MAYCIGTDEAGYGPNLGPLIVSATVWQVPDDLEAEAFYERLGDAVEPGPVRSSKDRVPIADSKILYRPGGGLGNLERGLFCMLELLNRCPASWRDAWRLLTLESMPACLALPWYADFDLPLPRDVPPTEIQALSGRLAPKLVAAGIRLIDVRSRALFPSEFNRLVDHHGTKGAVLSHATLELAARLAATLDSGLVSIVCDKHGGRNRYASLIDDHFPDQFVEIHGESRAQSVYQFGPADRRFEIRFRVKAEACLPVALASMASKYLRELAMHAFNAYWCGRVDGLRPTAGYPQDAKRFKAAIAECQKELNIEDAALWRQR